MTTHGRGAHARPDGAPGASLISMAMELASGEAGDASPAAGGRQPYHAWGAPFEVVDPGRVPRVLRRRARTPSQLGDRLLLCESVLAVVDALAILELASVVVRAAHGRSQALRARFRADVKQVFNAAKAARFAAERGVLDGLFQPEQCARTGACRVQRAYNGADHRGYGRTGLEGHMMQGLHASKFRPLRVRGPGIAKSG